MSTIEDETNEIESVEEPQSKIIEVPVEEIKEEAIEPPKPKAKARGKRGVDKKPRVKPKPKARKVITQPIQESSESEESVDEATLQEIHSLNLLRSIRSYENQRINNKQRMYASWFGR